MPQYFVFYCIFMTNESHILDTRGLQCPLPLLKAKRAMSQLETGEQLLVLVTDPTSQRDFVAWTDIAQHTLVSVEEKDGEYHYLLTKG
jgi:TusA-related sulfurtransferase